MKIQPTPRKTNGATLQRHAAIALLIALTACGPRPDENKSSVDQPAAAATPSTERLLAGGGLPGLPKLANSRFLSANDSATLMTTVYPDESEGVVTVQHDENLFNAVPQMAYRADNGDIIFLVGHTNTEECHICEGSTSVFRLDRSGKTILASSPFSLPGMSWGGTAPIALAQLPNGKVVAFLESSYSQMGYSCSSREVFDLESSPARSLASFPDVFDNTGNYGPTSLQIAGIEAKSPESLKIKWTGVTKTADGSQEPIFEERTVTLDGAAEPWISSWPHTC